MVRIIINTFTAALIALSATLNSSADDTRLGFSSRDVERHCEVYRYSDDYGEIDCSRSRLNPLERYCEAYLYDDEYGELECRGSEFRTIERECEVYMYSYEYGEIDC